ncbi:hypothetical protein [Enterococcus durans]|uniref:hypothetical protein n=1 Tax=Enterococcus durans TaxID=53345 RepID=UPI00356AE45C
MKKILPISTKPIVSCYNDESFRYNIINQYPSFEGWIAMEYFDLCMNKDVFQKNSQLKGYHTWPYVVPNLEESKIQRNFMKRYLNKINIVDLIVQTIKNDTYVYLFLNEYFLPNRFAYKTENWTHDNLIIGFDLDQSIFYLLGYGMNGLIEISEVSFVEFENSYECLNEIHEEFSDIFFIKPTVCTFEFDLTIFYKRLVKYFRGDNLNDYLVNFSFGYNTYHNILQYYAQYLLEYDIRNVHKLLEQKKCLLRSFQYIKKEILFNKTELDRVINEFKELVSKCEEIKKLTIKYNVYTYNYKKQKTEYIEKIRCELLKLMKKEKRCLITVITMLEEILS